MVPYFGSLIDRGILSNLTAPEDDFLNSRALKLKCSPAHFIRHLIEFTKEIAKSHRPSQVLFKLTKILEIPSK